MTAIQNTIVPNELEKRLPHLWRERRPYTISQLTTDEGAFPRTEEPMFKIGSKIRNIHTGKEKVIERIEVVYVCTNGTHYDSESLITWTLVDEQEVEKRPPTTPK